MGSDDVSQPWRHRGLLSGRGQSCKVCVCFCRSSGSCMRAPGGLLGRFFLSPSSSAWQSRPTTSSFSKKALSASRAPTSSSWSEEGATGPWWRLLRLLQTDGPLDCTLRAALLPLSAPCGREPGTRDITTPTEIVEERRCLLHEKNVTSRRCPEFTTNISLTRSRSLLDRVSGTPG